MNWCGILTVDKPGGMTSRRVVDRVAKLVRPAKAGHAGTLDPLATGVLVVCVGGATRLISHVQQGRKRYVGRFRLGQRSNTDDIDGEVVGGGDWSSITKEMLAAILREFVGMIQQTPPQFSAVHVAGRRAHELARRGETVELVARLVEVCSIRLTDFQPPEFELEIECGSGTYVRSIGRDVGERLECGAVMTSLRRLAVGSFDLSDAVPFDTLDEITVVRALRPPLDAVAKLPRRMLDPHEIILVRQGGHPVPCDSCQGTPAGSEVSLVDRDEQLIGIAQWDAASQRLLPRIVLSANG